MLKFVELIEATNRHIGRMVAWAAVAMMLFQVVAVLLRYVFSYGLVTFQEAVVYCHAALFMLGAAYVLQLNEHVRVDIFYGAMSKQAKQRIDRIALLFFVLPVAAVIGWYSVPYVMRSWQTFEGSRQAGGIPAIYLLKTTMVVFAVSLGMQALTTLIRLMGWVPESSAWQLPGDADDQKRL